MSLSTSISSAISLAVSNHYDYVNSNFLSKDGTFTPIWISPYGSMNYGTYNPKKSDTDTKMIVLPSYQTLLWEKPFIKEYHPIPNNEICSIMDIRHFTKSLLKQSINFVEVLFSEYAKNLNTDFLPIWTKYFLDNRELIAHYDEKACIHATCHQALNILNQGAEYDGKKYANVLRLIDFIDKYSQQYPFPECIKVSSSLIDEVMTFKNGDEIPGCARANLAKLRLMKVLEVKDNMFNFFPEAKEIVYEGTEKLIKKNLELTK